MIIRIAMAALCGCLLGAAAQAEALVLEGVAPGETMQQTYRCDAPAEAMGLPAKAFTVLYINSDSNNLAIVPVKDARLVFANVVSASGARYAAGSWVWWEKGGTVTFSEAAGRSATCRQIAP
jgi:membrane-bound inhibitor of C-type lysozyme